MVSPLPLQPFPRPPSGPEPLPSRPRSTVDGYGPDEFVGRKGE